MRGSFSYTSLFFGLMLVGCVEYQSFGALRTGETISGSTTLGIGGRNTLEFRLPNGEMCSGEYLADRATNERRFPISCENGVSGTAVMIVEGSRPNESATTQFVLENGQQGTIRMARGQAAAAPGQRASASPQTLQSARLSGSEAERVRNAVRSRLVDPGSATFSDFVAADVTGMAISFGLRNSLGLDRREALPENYRVVCGRVNARNQLGGYVGAQAFIAINDGRGYVATPGGRYDAYGRVCRERYGLTPPVQVH